MVGVEHSRWVLALEHEDLVHISLVRIEERRDCVVQGRLEG